MRKMIFLVSNFQVFAPTNDMKKISLAMALYTVCPMADGADVPKFYCKHVVL